MAGHGLLGDAVRVHSLRPPLALVRDAQLRRGHEGQPQTRPAYRSDAEPRLELVQRGLREMGDPARPERTEADGLRQVARLLHARRLAKPHERSARDLVPGRRRAALHQALLGRPRRGGAHPGAAASDPALQHCQRSPRRGWESRTRARRRLLPRQYELDERVLVGRHEAAPERGGDPGRVPEPSTAACASAPTAACACASSAATTDHTAGRTAGRTASQTAGQAFTAPSSESCSYQSTPSSRPSAREPIACSVDAYTVEEDFTARGLERALRLFLAAPWLAWNVSDLLSEPGGRRTGLDLRDASCARSSRPRHRGTQHRIVLVARTGRSRGRAQALE